MNKRHTGKLLAFLLAVVFMFTLVPRVFADGDIDQWTYIHSTSGTHGDMEDGYWKDILEPKSRIKITGTDGNEIIADENGVYKDIPVESEIELDIGFHFSNNSDAYHDLNPGAYFEFTLPKGIEFNSVSGDVLLLTSNDRK